MKKIFYFLVPVLLAAGASFLFFGCDDTADNQAASGLKYLSISESRVQNYTDNDRTVMRETFKRVDPYVVFQNGEFRLTLANPSNVAISKQLYTNIVTTIQKTNTFLRNKEVVEVGPNVLRVIGDKDPLSAVRLKGFGEDVLPKNSDGYDLRWYGFDLYLSTKTIENARKSGDAYAASLRAQGTIPKDIAAVIVQCSTNIISQLNFTCDEGGIIECWWLAGPVSARCQ